MKPPFDIPADLDTPVSAFLKLRPLQPRFLLESVEGGERVGRYSIIGFGDAVQVRLDDRGIVVDGEVIAEPRTADELIAGLRAALARCPRPGPQTDLPFHGGLVGATSYDVVRRFESLPSHAGPSPHPEGAWVGVASVLVFDHATRRAALLHDGTPGERAALRSQVVELLRGPAEVPSGQFEVEEAHHSLDKSTFEEAVRTVQHHIHEGDVYQLVPSIRFSGRTTVPPFQAYRALRLLNPSPYMYFCDFGDLAVVGSSPEALVRMHGREAELRPIAGTRPRGSDDAEDKRLELELLADPKEAAEHVMLVDLARNDLGRVAVAGSVHVEPSRIIERYSHVMHIVSGVRGVLSPGLDCFDLFAATFPAGTVVGAPKVRAMEIIDRLEPIRRGLYAGTVGYFGHGGTMDQAIAIRTLVFQGDTYSFQAGAGVVADSRPDFEHAECVAKSAALRSALELAQEGL
jgi:anthranilate synthase component 1